MILPAMMTFYHRPEQVQDMVDQGLDATESELALITEYLNRTFVK